MKKNLRFYFFLMFALLCGSTFAENVIFTAGADEAATDDTTLTKSGVTLQIAKGNGASIGTMSKYDNYRIYKDNTFTVSSAAGNIVKIIFNCTAKGAAKYGPGCLSASEGYTYAGTVGTWAGEEAISVTFTAATAQVRVNSLVVVLNVAAPTITGQAEFDESDEVTISAAEDAHVYYTLDGTDPTAASTAYAAPFSIDTTTTVKAIAEKNGKFSSVDSSTFTKITFIPQTIASLAVYSGNMDNVEITFNKALVTYADDNNIYLREGDSAIVLYNTGLAMTGGKLVSGTARFNFESYHGIPELLPKKGFTNADKLTFADSESMVKPLSVSIADLLAGRYLAELVTLEGTIVSEEGETTTKYYLVVADSRIQLYSKSCPDLYKTVADNNKTYSVTALCNNYYNEAFEIEPVELVEEIKTGMDENISETADAEKAVFNLAGQRLAVPQKGLNIINGKTTLIVK